MPFVPCVRAHVHPNARERRNGHGTVHTADKPLARRAGTIGWLEIPRVGLSGVVVHGDVCNCIEGGIAHLPETPLPWSAGNSALAAHRDNIFRPLRHVRPATCAAHDTTRAVRIPVRETFVVDRRTCGCSPRHSLDASP